MWWLKEVNAHDKFMHFFKLSNVKDNNEKEIPHPKYQTENKHNQMSIRKKIIQIQKMLLIFGCQ